MLTKPSFKGQRPRAEGTSEDDVTEDLIEAYNSQLLHADVAPPDGEPRGYVRLAVMDGKNMGHRVGLNENKSTY